jgi:ubiquinone/menaquinone biosynthesis C-methylase UbiE
MKNNYDRIAGNYDVLSRLVFQKSIVRSQKALLPLLHVPCKLLIVGGGTGWILEELTQAHPMGLRITYVEISEKMIALARNRDTGKNRVCFVHSAIEDFVSDEQFDAVMTPFLFDNFNQERAEAVFSKLDTMLMPGGNWLFVDFHIEKKLKGVWQKILLKSMYWFFATVCNVEARKLPDMGPLFQNAGYAPLHRSLHFHGFIQSVGYRKIIPLRRAS